MTLLPEPFNTERGQTTVIVTHGPKSAPSIDRTIHVQDGLIEDHAALALVGLTRSPTFRRPDRTTERRLR